MKQMADSAPVALCCPNDSNKRSDEARLLPRTATSSTRLLTVSVSEVLVTLEFESFAFEPVRVAVFG
jgi:hypothetical protein